MCRVMLIGGLDDQKKNTKTSVQQITIISQYSSLVLLG